MSAAQQVDLHTVWLEGWNAALGAVAAVVSTSGIPEDIATPLVGMVTELVAD